MWCAADRGRSFIAYPIAFRALDDAAQLKGQREIASKARLLAACKTESLSSLS